MEVLMVENQDSSLEKIYDLGRPGSGSANDEGPGTIDLWGE